MGVTKDLSQAIVSTQYGDFDVEAIEAAKLCLIDWIGVTLAGNALEPMGEILVKYVKSQGGRRQATVLGRGFKTTILNAALVNGCNSHVLDLDDVLLILQGHPSVPLVAGLLALGEHKHVSGREYLTSFILGFEVIGRVSDSIMPEHYNLGWHSTGVIGRLGVAAGAGKMLDLDGSQMAQALGIGGTQAAGVREILGTMSKSLNGGKSAADGVLSAQLAKLGFSSTEAILEGKDGFGKLFSPKFDPDKVVSGWGKRWHVNDVIFKRHASAYCTHALIEAVARLRKQASLTPEEVLSIEGRVRPLAYDIANNPSPAAALHGKFSLQFCAAMALSEGHAGLEVFKDERVKDPKVIDLMSRIRLIPDPEIIHTRAVVTVTTREGRTITEDVDILPMHLDSKWRAKSIPAKFRELVVPILGQKKAEKILRLCQDIDKIEDISLIPPLAG